MVFPFMTESVDKGLNGDLRSKVAFFGPAHTIADDEEDLAIGIHGNLGFVIIMISDFANIRFESVRTVSHLVLPFHHIFGAKLATCGIDASAPFFADGAVDAVVVEIQGEGFSVFIERSLKWFFFNWVKRDEVDVTKDAAESRRKLFRTFDGVVDTFDEDVMLSGGYPFNTKKETKEVTNVSDEKPDKSIPTEANDESEKVVETTGSVFGGPGMIWIILLVVVVVGVGAGTAIFIRKRNKTE